MTELTVPPHNLEAEEALLGCMLLDADAIGEAQEIVGSDDFYKDGNKQIYETILELYVNGQPADGITLADALKKKGNLQLVGGKAYIHTLLSCVPTATSVMHYAKIVADNGTLRRLANAAGQIVSIAMAGAEDVPDTIDIAEDLIFQVSHSQSSEGYKYMTDLLEGTEERLKILQASDSHVTGLPTGFYDLDVKTAGLQPSDFIVVAGRPSMGKTSFALDIAKHVAIDQGKTVAIFSLEMNSQQLVQRMLSSESRVDSSKLQVGNLSERDWGDVREAMVHLSTANIIIDDTANINMMGIRSKARRMMSKDGLDLIIVDYLQLMHGHGRSDSRQQEVADISRSMKILGRELNVPVIAISQLSRKLEERQNKRPMLSDLRESGAIEQDADLVMFIYRDDMYNENSDAMGEAEIIVGKHRHGPTGTIKLAFQERFTSFSDMGTGYAAPSGEKVEAPEVKPPGAPF